MISVKRGNAPLGAEVVGLDLAKDLTEQTFNEVVHAFHAHEVLFFRGQNLTPEQHIAISKRFGPLELHMRKECCRPGYPEIFVVSNIVENGKPIGAQDAGLIWHSDMCFMREPSRGSLFYAKEVPQRDGQPLGDTLFASTTAAYDALPQDMKQRLSGLKAVNSYAKGYARVRRSGPLPPLSQQQKDRAPDVEHPVLRTHLFTGKKCLFVNEGYTTRIVGLPEHESDALLQELITHLTRPEFTYRHKWQVGDFLLWDNCSTQHLATSDYELPQRRLMERTTLRGTAPV